MAADVLAYDTDKVPVATISASTSNSPATSRSGSTTATAKPSSYPRARVRRWRPRVMDLQDPTAKMSKSIRFVDRVCARCSTIRRSSRSASSTRSPTPTRGSARPPRRAGRLQPPADPGRARRSGPSRRSRPSTHHGVRPAQDSGRRRGRRVPAPLQERYAELPRTPPRSTRNCRRRRQGRGDLHQGADRVASHRTCPRR